ncbi:MAG: hypothetical protein MJ089_04045 [Ruminococcus sp.]|nr:hypothetical protein [Ruminococcus sp.]
MQFDKNNQKNKNEYEIETENLAVPEIHTGKVKIEDTEEKDNTKKSSVSYETLAIPEIHIKKKNQ